MYDDDTWKENKWYACFEMSVLKLRSYMLF